MEDTITKTIEGYYRFEHGKVVKKYITASCLSDSAIEVQVLLRDHVVDKFVLDRAGRILSVVHELPEVN